MSEQIKSLAKALQVLEYLGKRPEGTSLAEISDDLKMSKPSIHRILATYEHTGFVEQLTINKNYKLTLKLMHIGYSALNSKILGLVKPELNTLLLKINETINFLGFNSDNVIFLEKLEPDNASFRTRTYVGLHLPMYCSAAGKCFLAFSSRQVQEDYWIRNASVMKQLTQNTIIDKNQFFQELSKIREEGFAVDDEENEIGISCIALPLFNREKIPIYAISISTLTPRIKKVGYANFASLISECIKEIQLKLI